MLESSTSGALFARVTSASGAPAATAIKAATGKLKSYDLYNSGTIAYLKLFNTTATVTVGTTVPDAVIVLPATSKAALDLSCGINFQSGLQYAITGGAGDSDTTALTAAQVVGTLSYY